jgi:threonine synthase
MVQYYSTKNKNSQTVSLKDAVLKGLPDDNGLYMPTEIGKLPQNFFDTIQNYSFQEIAYQILTCFGIQDEIDSQKLHEIIEKSLTFDAPLVNLVDKNSKSQNANVGFLELFHGNTLAFKDFGARFMAQLLGYFVEKQDRKLHILVATSGDTGSAVAHGFLGVPNIEITVLYPSGKVSKRQEKQFATLGQNITALEIAGTFDDCQALVKSAFLDKELNEKLYLSSANSINIARLIPQSFYYFRAYQQAIKYNLPLVFVVPSGNFGNLTAGLFAKKMGLPIQYFVAATNTNDIVPKYLETGIFNSRSSIQTISNAMDVGNPSNFARMLDLYDNKVENMRKDITGFACDEATTRQIIRQVKQQFDYVIEPHAAVAFSAWQEFRKTQTQEFYGIVLGTAHPAKFNEVVEQEIQQEIPLPKQLSEWIDKPTLSIPLKANFEDFKGFLMERC